jgi:acyl carrier protein
MTQRTNQFNATTIRRNEAELRAFVDSGCDCWNIDVSDRFGQYGQTGIVIFQMRGESLFVDTLALSCRVLGRGVEHRLLVNLAGEAIRQGARFVTIPFAKTAKNQPVETFLHQTAEFCGTEKFHFPVEKLRALRWRPSTAASPRDETRPVQFSNFPYLHVARSLASADQIVHAMREGIAFDADRHSNMSALERRLASIWSEILKVPSVAIDDNFFDLGGHSLLVVLLQLRVKEEFGVELDVDEVYSGTLTLASLASKIELRQIGDLSSEEYRAIVAEIESLSDEEVERLLIEESR